MTEEVKTGLLQMLEKDHLPKEIYDLLSTAVLKQKSYPTYICLIAYENENVEYAIVDLNLELVKKGEISSSDEVAWQYFEEAYGKPMIGSTTTIATYEWLKARNLDRKFSSKCFAFESLHWVNVYHGRQPPALTHKDAKGRIEHMLSLLEFNKTKNVVNEEKIVVSETCPHCGESHDFMETLNSKYCRCRPCKEGCPISCQGVEKVRGRSSSVERVRKAFKKFGNRKESRKKQVWTKRTEKQPEESFSDDNFQVVEAERPPKS